MYDVPNSTGFRDLRTLADRVNYLFRVRLNPETHRSYTSKQVALAVPGAVSYQNIDKIRSGANTNPTRDTLIGLSTFFEVPVAFFFPELDDLRTKPLPY